MFRKSCILAIKEQNKLSFQGKGNLDEIVPLFPNLTRIFFFKRILTVLPDSNIRSCVCQTRLNSLSGSAIGTDYRRPVRKSPSLHIRQRPHGIKNLDNQIYGLIITFMASRHVFECEIEYLVVKSCHIWFK